MYLDKIELQVLQDIARQQLMPPGSSVLVACSGGPDSVALVHLLSALRERLEIGLAVCHFNHRLRGKEADDDAEFVGRLARDLMIPFSGGSGDVEFYADKNRLSIEEAARRLRYGFFEQVRARISADRVAIAHHADDNAETMLINLLRGSGSRGLAGIPPQRGPYIRPLLRLHREQISAYLKTRGIAYRIDSSNDKLDFLRNRLRRELLPQLNKINPGLVETLSRTGEIFREENRLLDELALSWLGRFGKELPSGFEIDSAQLCAADPALQRRVFRMAVGQCRGDLRRLSLAHAEAFLQLAGSDDPGASIDLPGDIKIRRAYGKITIEKGGAHKPISYKARTFVVPGEIEWPPFLLIGEVLPTPPLQFPARNSNRTLFPVELAERGLVIRTARRGERMRPFGGRTKKVSDLFIDTRIERRQRTNHPVLADEKGVLWIPGVARADRVPMVDKQGPCLLLRCLKQEEPQPE